MLKIAVITQQNDLKFWQETFSNVWEGPVDISLQNNYQGKDNADLVIFDFSLWDVNALDVLNDISPVIYGDGNQTRDFTYVDDTVDGIILAKADVDEKGGAAVSVSYVTKKPILFLGTGQGYDDLTPFRSELVVESLGLTA